MSIYNFCDYFISPFNFVKSRIGQLLMFSYFILDVALYKHVFITCIVLAVMAFCDKSNLLTFVQNVVNMPMFDKKLSSSSLQFLSITYMPLLVVEGVLISLMSWHSYIKFCLLNLMLVKFILLRVGNVLQLFKMTEISFCWSGVFERLSTERFGWSSKESINILMCF